MGFAFCLARHWLAVLPPFSLAGILHGNATPDEFRTEFYGKCLLPLIMLLPW